MKCHIDLDLREGLNFPLDFDELQAICETLLDFEGVYRPCFVSVSVVTDAEMRTTNMEWRGIDRPTDVISVECERPDDLDLAEDEPCELGDIVLAADYIEHQAASFGTTFADECRLLVVHGLLHLLGYDHMQEDEAHVMQAKEEQLLAILTTDGTLSDVVLTRHREEEDA